MSIHSLGCSQERGCRVILFFGMWLLIAITGLAIAAAQDVSSRRAPHRIATHMTAFGLPFAIHDPHQQFVEVQLYVSKDRGQTWQFYGRQPTDARSFPFQSSGDGEYWFAIKTLDRDRQLLPAGEMVAEQIVLIDTRRPVLDFRVQTDAAGRVVVRWRAEDENIDPESVKLAYRPLVSADDRENAWIDVPYRAVAPAQGGVFADQYAWWLSVSAQEVLIRLIVADLAGNQAIEERQIASPRVVMKSGQLAMSNPIDTAAELERARTTHQTVSPSPTEVQTLQHPIAPPSHRGYGVEENPADGSANEQNQPRAPGLASSPYPSPAQTHVKQDDRVVTWESVPRSGSGIQENNRQTWPDQPQQAPILTGHAPHSTNPETPTHANDPQAAGRMHNTKIAASTTSAAASNESEHQLGAQSTAKPLAPPLHHQPPGSLHIPSQLAKNVPDLAPSGPTQSVLDANRPSNVPQTIAVNSRRFRLDYDLGSIAQADVARVVLWITKDRGQTWESQGEDFDLQSPMPVEVDGDGLYGFRIAVHTRSGLVGRAPARGDDADAWVRVDLNPPVAQITSAPYGRDLWVGHLIINWTAVDEQFRHRPIHLSYSTTADGPWTTIADGLDNSGSHAWKVDASVPARVHLRLDAVDAAGNVTTSITTEPVDLTGLVPQSRIIGVQPVR